MVTLSTTDAVNLVRKNLDEIGTNSSVMLTDDYEDNRNLDLIIKEDLPEAINAVSLAAPSALLEGKTAGSSDRDSVSVSSDGVLSFSLKSTTKYLRLVAFRAADSQIVVTDTLPEASPEGRKQLNKYVRGRFDRPRLVLLQDRHTGPAFKYYTLKNPSTYTANPESAIAQLSYVEEQFYAADATGYNISRRLRQNIIDYLTAMVLETFSDQRAQVWYQKANSFPSI